mgnify:CR=1 FL=1
MTQPTSLFEQFRNAIQTKDAISDLTAGLVGHHVAISGPLGKKPLLYADYVASERALREIEDFGLKNKLKK